jgi:hypothetical protein
MRPQFGFGRDEHEFRTSWRACLQLVITSPLFSSAWELVTISPSDNGCFERKKDKSGDENPDNQDGPYGACKRLPAVAREATNRT